ncbi:MAG: SCO family protein [Phenylobacterium sp.]|uniref:SCO family protein n=1 Tax=Phenylobacterium sp. TaxID=1871053 RepID=UPI001A500140|nr:SCO family protein [Phenylobacterium sp.]MBL8556525.1 SCO family protein [Phenylobacterium sp.]
MSRRILALVAVLAIALAILTGLAVRRGVLGPAPQTVAVGGPFQLIDTSGRTVSQDVLKGKWSVVFFGFTHCPDICPTTLFEMGQVEPLLGPDAAKVQTVFVTVDPARDTVAQMKAYVANPAFPKRLVGLTGSQAQVDATAKAYRVFHQKVGEGADYQVNHAAYSYLMNPRGRFACVLPYELTPEQTVAKIRAAMRNGDDAASC